MYAKEREELWASLNTNKIERNFLLNTLLGKDLKKNWSKAISNFLKRISAKRVRIANWGRISDSVLVSPLQCVIILCNLCVWSMVNGQWLSFYCTYFPKVKD